MQDQREGIGTVWLRGIGFDVTKCRQPNIFELLISCQKMIRTPPACTRRPAQHIQPRLDTVFIMRPIGEIGEDVGRLTVPVELMELIKWYVSFDPLAHLRR